MFYFTFLYTDCQNGWLCTGKYRSRSKWRYPATHTFTLSCSAFGILWKVAGSYSYWTPQLYRPYARCHLWSYSCTSRWHTTKCIKQNTCFAIHRYYMTLCSTLTYNCVQSTVLVWAAVPVLHCKAVHTGQWPHHLYLHSSVAVCAVCTETVWVIACYNSCMCSIYL